MEKSQKVTVFAIELSKLSVTLLLVYGNQA